MEKKSNNYKLNISVDNNIMTRVLKFSLHYRSNNVIRLQFLQNLLP